jgi:hypothetical protein
MRAAASDLIASSYIFTGSGACFCSLAEADTSINCFCLGFNLASDEAVGSTFGGIGGIYIP